MNDAFANRKKTARLAGLLYLLLAIAGYYGMMYAPGQVIIKGDPTGTAHNLVVHQFLFRTGIAAHLASVIAVRRADGVPLGRGHAGRQRCL